MKRIPPNVLWPLIIILLLASNIAIAVGTFFAANSGGGVQVVPDYYAAAVAWDSVAAASVNSKHLGWIASVTANRKTGAISVLVSDKSGVPIDGLRGSISVSRPQSAEPIGSFDLTPAGPAGAYEAAAAFGVRGLYDFKVAVSDSAESFTSTTRLELQ